jgi:nitroimidazol reductase NimA-like FMN-containing flavoprotein (pyridoxamine 5'-phosphate oxidase superfamily)
MPEPIHDYEQVSVYALDPAEREELLATHAECTFNWATRDGWPMGVIMSYLWKDGRFWLTAGAHRHRIEAVRRDPRVSIVVTSTGTKLAPGKSITAKGRCAVHEDAETKAWFYPAFARHLYPEERQARAFEEKLASPLRVVLEVIPEKWISYDGVKMFLDAAGKLPPERRSAPRSSDTTRLARELERRGLAQEES